jgi:hypothetical protein
MAAVAFIHWVILAEVAFVELIRKVFFVGLR